jgi:hypothetical protein
MFRESYAKEMRKIQLVDYTVGIRISAISEDLCDQLFHQLKTSRFAMHAMKDKHLITRVRYEKDTIFCKPTDRGNTSL